MKLRILWIVLVFSCVPQTENFRVVRPGDFGLDTNFTLHESIMDTIGADSFLIVGVSGTNHFDGLPLDNLVFEFDKTSEPIDYTLRFERNRLPKLPPNTALELFSPENKNDPLTESWLYYIRNEQSLAQTGVTQ